MDEALDRLEDGRYGLCEDCGVEIGDERLRVATYALCCVRCQQQREGLARGPGGPSGAGDAGCQGGLLSPSFP